MSRYQHILYEKQGKLGIIYFNRPKVSNAVTGQTYTEIISALEECKKDDEIVVVVIFGKGRFWSAGADVQFMATDQTDNHLSQREKLTRGFMASNITITRAIYEFPKILVCGLNGPAIGVSAGLVGLFDFVYSTNKAYLLTPFSNLGLVGEAASTFSFVQRLGLSKANEALLLSKPIYAKDLYNYGLVNEIFDMEPQEFINHLVCKVQDDFNGLEPDSLYGIKQLVKTHFKNQLDSTNIDEAVLGIDRFMTGIPNQRFVELATGKRRHKL